MRGGARRRAFTLAAVAVALTAGLPAPAPTSGASLPGQSLRADLNGTPIELGRVGSLFCQDFAYPQIHCYSTARSLEAAVAPITAAGTGTYVTVYEYTSLQGAYMYMSQDYSLLGLIGWNDRISSFRSVNSGAGTFWTDWLYSGSFYGFCCNQVYYSLGSYDNTFSSVYRN